ncbi:hypothetical protein [Metabacillus idriensis]|uniref:hypothetical protein n=1 Tax=Metabacillus idriensis TaxID=324768 RepID=UPI00174D3E98|nr:hypothetical protein [Metabacillus idriensis]
MNTKAIINNLQETLTGVNTNTMAQIWNSFDELTIQNIRKMKNPYATIYHIGNTVIVEFLCRDSSERRKIEIEECHISDDKVNEYYEGLAFFLNEIRSDIYLYNHFYYGLVYDDENDVMIYDEVRFKEEHKPELVFYLVNHLLSYYK